MTLPEISSVTGFAGVAAVAALIATTWRQIVTVGRYVSGLVVCRVAVKNDLSEAVMSYVWERGRQSPLGLRLFGGTRAYVHPTRRVEVVAYESVSSEPLLMTFKGRPLVISLFFSGGTNQNIGRVAETPTGGAVTLMFLRGTFDVEGFLLEAVQHFNALHNVQKDRTKNLRRRFAVRRCRWTNGDTSIPTNPTSPAAQAPRGADLDCDDVQRALLTKSIRLLQWKADDLVEGTDDRSPFVNYPFPSPVFSAMDEIRVWLQNESWFREKGVPWRRGWLLHGPPGTGKSTLVRALGMEFDLPIYTFDLSGMDNSAFSMAWQEVQQNAPAIALIEDIDAVFEGRKNIAQEGRLSGNLLTFDCLLNTISGVGNSDGVLLMVTTNRVDVLDPALGVPQNGRSTRPGRIDRVINLGPMERAERLALANRMLVDFPAAILETVAAGEGETAAQFQDRCAQLALQLFWRSKVA